MIILFPFFFEVILIADFEGSIDQYDIDIIPFSELAECTGMMML